MVESSPFVVCFFDNDKEQFKGKNKLKHVECIHIDDQEKNKLLCQSKYKNMLYFDAYIDKYGDNILGKIAKVYPMIQEPNSEIPVVSNGMTSETFENLKKWCKEHKYKTKYIFFDWDQTLSVQNGFYVLENFPTTPFIKEYLYFIVGGKERFSLLQKMFSFLHRCDCKVFILTNNNAADRNSKCQKTFRFFLKMIKILDPKFKKKNLLYGMDFETTNLMSSKMNYIDFILKDDFAKKKNNYFRQFCKLK